MRALALACLFVGLLGACEDDDARSDDAGSPDAQTIDAAPTTHCDDGVFGDGEQGLDCGWTCDRPCDFAEKCGLVEEDQTWEGNVHAACFVEVAPGATLTIAPGAVVKFRHHRDYRSFGKAGLDVAGTIRALGTEAAPIWLTSDAPDPINGDWVGISVGGSRDSAFDHVIVEFSEIGIAQLDAAVPVTHSILRWTNSEGLYAERSTPVYENNLLYGCAYHEIALEQYNTDVQIRGNHFAGGRFAIHHERTQSVIAGNTFAHYDYEFVISAGMTSEIDVRDNQFHGADPETFLNVYDSVVNDDAREANSFPPIEELVVPAGVPADRRNFALDYLPGDPEKDRFPYVYAAEDETRRVVRRLGEGLHFGWALVFAEGYLWRFSLGGGTIGRALDFIRIDPVTGESKRFGTDEIQNPRGLAFDGESFWINDFSTLQIHRFAVPLEGDTHIGVTASYVIPHVEEGGTMGMTSDGSFLYLRSRDSSRLYQLGREAAGDELPLVAEIPFEGGGVGSGLTWADGAFWTEAGCLRALCKHEIDTAGADPFLRAVGGVHPVAKDAWALAWDGEHLWSLQRTNENADDAKIFEIEILNDSF